MYRVSTMCLVAVGCLLGVQSAAQQEKPDVEIVSLGVSPFGTYVAAGCADGGILVFEAGTAEIKHRLRGHSEPVEMLAWGGKERWLLSADRKQVRFWDLNDGSLAHHFEINLPPIYEIALSPDSRFALMRGFDGFGMCVDLNEKHVRYHTYGYSMAINPTGTQFATGCHRGVNPLVLYSLVPGEDRVTHVKLEDMVRHVAYSQDGRRILAIGRKMHLVRARDGWPLGPPVAVRGGAPVFSRDGRTIAVAVDWGIRGVNARTGRVLWEARGPTSGLAELTLVNRDTEYVFAHDAQQAALWRWQDDRPVWTKQGRVAINRNGTVGAAYSPDEGLYLLDPRTGEHLKSLPLSPEEDSGIEIIEPSGSYQAPGTPKSTLVPGMREQQLP